MTALAWVVVGLLAALALVAFGVALGSMLGRFAGEQDREPEPEAQPEPTAEPRCPAHGHEACPLCSLNPGTCGDEDSASPGCGYYLATGMHWDTCPSRVLTRADAEARGLL